MNREKLIEEMIVKYGFSNQVPPEIRRRITDRKSQVFQKVIRSGRGYSASFAALAAIFFFMKKLGIGLNFLQSMVAFFTAVTLATAAVTFGAYTAVKAVREHGQKRELIIPSPLDDRRPLSRPAIPRPAVADETVTGAHPAATGSAPTLSLDPSSITVIGLSSGATDSLRRSLEASLRRYYPGPVGPSGASLALKGSLIKTETGHDLYLRLVSPNGAIVESFQYSSPGLEGILARTDAMALDIARRVSR